MAQTPAGFAVSVSARAPAALVPFTITDSGAKPNQLVTLTMTPNPASIGTRSLTQHANARGVVNFAVALTQDGIYVLTSTSASGAVLGTETVTVSQHGSVVVAGSSASAGTAAGGTAGKAASAPAGKAASAPAGTAASAPAGTAASAPAGTAAGTAASAPAGTAVGTAAGSPLAFTGWQGMGLAGGGGVLVLAGTALVLATRRRALTQP
jgi:hypothetical protein